MHFRTIALSLILTMCFRAPQLFAQTVTPVEPNWKYFSLSAGVGASWGTAVIISRLPNRSLFNQAQARKVSSTPVYGLSFEKRFNQHLGFGAAFSYQSYKLIFMDFDPNFRQVVGNNIDQYERMNYAVRGLVYMGKSKKLDMYWALRVGYTDWTLYTTSGDWDYIRSRELKDALSLQMVYGMRYFAGKIGFGYEVGIGTAPYLVMANACLKFND